MNIVAVCHLTGKWLVSHLCHYLFLSFIYRFLRTLTERGLLNIRFSDFLSHFTFKCIHLQRDNMSTAMLFFSVLNQFLKPA